MEKGKPTCQAGKALELSGPPAEASPAQTGLMPPTHHNCHNGDPHSNVTVVMGGTCTSDSTIDGG